MARGIAIILMIIGHVLDDGWKKNLIFSFHMPLFIILSGFFYKDKSLKETIINIIKKLILPYIICAFITDIIIGDFNIKNIIEIWGKQIIFSYTFWNKLDFNTDALRLGVLWFFPLLALVKLIFSMLKKVVKENDITLFSICLLLMYIGYIIGIKGYWLPFSFDVVLVSIVFYFIGYIFAKKDLLLKIIDNKVGMIIITIIWVIGINYNSIELAIRNYNDMFFSTLTAICGTIVIIKVSHIIANKTHFLRRILIWYGKNSMYVLLLHHIEISLINYYDILKHINNAKIFKCAVSTLKVSGISMGVLLINIIKRVKIIKRK